MKKTIKTKMIVKMFLTKESYSGPSKQKNMAVLAMQFLFYSQEYKEGLLHLPPQPIHFWVIWFLFWVRDVWEALPLLDFSLGFLLIDWILWEQNGLSFTCQCTVFDFRYILRELFLRSNFTFFTLSNTCSLWSSYPWCAFSILM